MPRTARSRLFGSVEGSVKPNGAKSGSESESESSASTATQGETAIPEVVRLKSELMQLSERTNRGFTASTDDRRTATQLVESLQRFRSVPEPARSYYDPSTISSVHIGDDDEEEVSGSSSSRRSRSKSSISGKWTLIYTDAPDITGLDTSRNPLSTAKLGRIGQECDPPYIKNVIEWLRPDWAKGLPFSGTDDTRILQKVVTKGSATPAKPDVVELKVAGFELEAGGDDTAKNKNNNNNYINDDEEESSSSSSSKRQNVIETIQSRGFPAGILSANPIDLKGPLNPPFGRFEILYLDHEIRAIRTSQNFLAVNRRIANKEDEWF